jgi:hypothetical protein
MICPICKLEQKRYGCKIVVRDGKERWLCSGLLIDIFSIPKVPDKEM